MVRILVLKRLYNLSDEQMEYQLLDRASYQRFCLLQDAMNVPDRNTIWRFGERLGVDGATVLFQGVDAQLHRHGYMARGGQAIDATLVPAPRRASAWTGRSARPWPKAERPIGVKPSAGKGMWMPHTRKSTAKATSATSSA